MFALKLEKQKLKENTKQFIVLFDGHLMGLVLFWMKFLELTRVLNAVLLFCTGLLKENNERPIVIRVFLQLRKEVVHSLNEISPIVPGK